MTVHVAPMPEAYRAIPRWLRPGIPPVFLDGPPTAADIALARELFAMLDPESQDWYGRWGVFENQA